MSNLFKTAAKLVKQFGMPVDEAFLGPWYLTHREMPGFTFYYLQGRVARINPDLVPWITERERLIYEQARSLGPNPWPLHPSDPTYCRVCFREKIYRRARCQRCCRQFYGARSVQKEVAKICGVPGCSEVHVAAGRCRLHYQRAYRAGLLWRPAAEDGLPLLLESYLAIDDIGDSYVRRHKL